MKYWFIITLFLFSSLTIAYSVSDAVSIATDSEKYLHINGMTRALNNDVILISQNSTNHINGSGVTNQYTSNDDGTTWINNGPVFSELAINIECTGGGIGTAVNGTIVVFLKCQNNSETTGHWGIRYATNTNDGEPSSWSGLNWLCNPYTKCEYPSNIITIGNDMYTIVENDSGSIITHSLYKSVDNGSSFNFVSIAYSHGELGEDPYYPNLLSMGNSTILWFAHQSSNLTNVARRSDDYGVTWGDIYYMDFNGVGSIREPDMFYLNGEYYLHGRNRAGNGEDYGIYSSSDLINWGSYKVIQEYSGNDHMAYSSDVNIDANHQLLVYSTDENQAKVDLESVILSSYSGVESVDVNYVGVSLN